MEDTIKLALPEEILLAVDKPARYTGNEMGCVIKDESGIRIRFALCFPDLYEIGMSHLGIQILYEMFNRRDDVWAQRVYSPWTDLGDILKEKDIPLFCLESQKPVREFDFLGITLQYEMCYTNILQVLELSQIPLLASERGEADPIVIGGGPCTYNPEPLADFFDIFYIGEGECSYDELFELYNSLKDEGNYSRAFFLHEASHIEGIYVPCLYEVSYNPDGTVCDFAPRYEDVPGTVRRVIVKELDEAVYPTSPVIPYVQATQDRIVLEIMRGCIRGCRFCQAGMVYRPNRERSLETLKGYAKQMMDNTGYDEISLSSLSSSDYSRLPELVNFLIEECSARNVNISLPSLRIDAFSLDVMKKVQDVKKTSLTFAPEAGSQRMRDVINKGITKEDILAGSEMAFKGGWSKVKLYFMLGLPGETDEDMKAIPELSNEIAALYYDTVPKEQRNGRCQITMSTSFFIPKPFTPFQWARMYPANEYKRRAALVNETMKEQLNRKSLKYQWHQTDVSVLEGVLARGDRRVGAVILKAYEKGAIFDAWSECFDNDIWMAAFKECGIDPDFYTMRERDVEEKLPWDFIDVGITKAFLVREWERSKQGIVTENCRAKCQGCGCAVYGGGVCHA